MMSRLIEDYNDVFFDEREDAFVKGFSLGARLTAEAFSLTYEEREYKKAARRAAFLYLDRRGHLLQRTVGDTCPYGLCEFKCGMLIFLQLQDIFERFACVKLILACYNADGVLLADFVDCIGNSAKVIRGGG